MRPNAPALVPTAIRQNTHSHAGYTPGTIPLLSHHTRGGAASCGMWMYSQRRHGSVPCHSPQYHQQEMSPQRSFHPHWRKRYISCTTRRSPESGHTLPPSLSLLSFPLSLLPSALLFLESTLRVMWAGMGWGEAGGGSLEGHRRRAPLFLGK